MEETQNQLISFSLTHLLAAALLLRLALPLSAWLVTGNSDFFSGLSIHQKNQASPAGTFV
jgi:hypothetical protein